MTPASRAEAVERLIDRCPPGFVAAGAFETSAAELGIANSEGQFC